VIDSRHQDSRFRSQASWLAGGRIAAAGLSAAWFVVLARSRALDTFGSLALLLSFGLMTSIITDLGLSGLLGDLVASRPECARPGIRVVIAKRMALSAAASVLTAVLYLIAGGQGGVLVPAVFAVSTFASSVYGTYTEVFRAIGHAGYEGANEAASRLVVLGIGSLIVVMTGGSLLAVVAVYAAVDLCSVAVLTVLFARCTEQRESIDGTEVLSLRAARSLAAAGIMSTFYFRIDAWLLALVRGERAVGRYAAAYRCFDALLLPTLAVSSLSIPYTSGLEGRALLERLRHIAAFSAAVTLPFAAATFIAAEPLVDVVFGARYASAVPALRVLAVGAVVSAAVGALLPALALRTPRIAGALLVSLVVNVAANLAVIPGDGAVGAACVTVACELSLGIWIAWRLRALVGVDPVLEVAG
jgi:O-antigen/teichoic acid export membrane protein